MLNNFIKYFYDILYTNKLIKNPNKQKENMLPILGMAQQVLSLVSVIQDLVGSDKNTSSSNHVEEIIQAKIADPVDKFSTEILDQINESVSADGSHKFNSFIDLVKG